MGPRDNQGYARISWPGYRSGGHRLVYMMTHDKMDLPSDTFVRHKCATQPCINPDHLQEGTPEENAQDRVDQGDNSKRSIWVRPPKKRTILSKEQKEEIRRTFISGDLKFGVGALSRKYKVSQAQIRQLVKDNRNPAIIESESK